MLRLGLEGLGLGLASEASRVFLPLLAIHTATGEASRVYSISLSRMVRLQKYFPYTLFSVKIPQKVQP